MTVLRYLIFFGFVPGLLPAQSITFSALQNGVPVPIDSIWVKNATAGGDTMLYSPDTVLVMDFSTEVRKPMPMDTDAIGLSISPAVPNPFDGITRFSVAVEDQGELLLVVYDATGRELATTRRKVSLGVHDFTYTGGSQGVLFVEAHWNGHRAVQRLLNLSGGLRTGLRYVGWNGATDRVRTKDGWFKWQMGDSLFYIVFATSPHGYIFSAASGETVTGPSTPLVDLLPGVVCAESPMVADIDGNIYPVVQIGYQCWMAENLKTTRYRNGDSIPNVTSSLAWQNLNTGAWCDYDNMTYYAPYGKLYNGYAAANPDICPLGWHVPTDLEWMALETELGMPAEELNGSGIYRGSEWNVGGKMKSTSAWWAPNSGATNESGFSGLPIGDRIGSDGEFIGYGWLGDWWSSSEDDVQLAWSRGVNYSIGGIARSNAHKRWGYCIRCLRD